MKHDGQLWNDILWSSRGNLNLVKCSYHHIHYAFSDDGEPYLSGIHGPPLVLSNANCSQQWVIQHKSSYDFRTTLGVHKSPIGEHSKQLQVLQLKSKTHGRTFEIKARCLDLLLCYLVNQCEVPTPFLFLPL
jgi:hypothetical protein